MIEEQVMELHDCEDNKIEVVCYDVEIEGETQTWELKSHACEYALR
jgi:hypothetical protein